MSQARLSLLALVLAVGPLACAASSAKTSDAEEEGSHATDAPLLGVTAGKDGADRACNVVLRTLARTPNTTGGFTTHCTSTGCWYVWDGTLDVSAAAVAAGAKPAVLYQVGSDPTWWKSVATPVAGAPQRFAVHIDDHTVPDGMSTTSLMRTVLKVAPMVEMPDGSRLFDHNRHPGDFDDYVLDAASSWSVVDDSAACAAPSRATLRFLQGWRTEQHGAIVDGGKLTIDYDLGRMPQCFSSTYNGLPAWATLAWGRFLPGGAVFQGPLTKFGGSGSSGAGLVATTYDVDVPEDATSVELWFETSGETCGVNWDSNYGKNYVFPVASKPTGTSPTWAGDWGSMISRSCAPEDLHAGVAEPLVFDSWVISRAVCHFVDVDVYVPGLTDQAEPRPEKILAQVEYARDAAPLEHAWLDFVGRVGNNYRFRWSVAGSGLDLVMTPWDRLSYAFRFSTNGNAWFRVAQGAGPDGGAARTITRGADFCPSSWTGKCK